MTINGKQIYAKEFAWDGCHKIYILNSKKDKDQALSCGYNILPIKDLKETFKNSCPLRFIHDWDFSTTYVSQDDNNKKVIFA